MALSAPTRPSLELASVIIPAYNEAKRLRELLAPLFSIPGLGQIILVDDASIDETQAVVSSLQAVEPRLRALRHPANLGKAAAMITGANASLNDLVLFLDADLVGLRQEHIDDLLRPVRERRAEMTLGVFQGGRALTDWSHLVSPFLSGQRALRWSQFRDVPSLSVAGSGVEVALTRFARRRGYRVEQVPMPGVTHVMKIEKLGTVRGLWAYASMYFEIFRFAIEHMLRAEASDVEKARIPRAGRRVRSPSRGAPFLDLRVGWEWGFNAENAEIPERLICISLWTQ